MILTLFDTGVSFHLPEKQVHPYRVNVIQTSKNGNHEHINNIMRIRIQQLNVIVGDIQGNSDAVIHALKSAEKDGVDLLVLPELVLCGYPPMDLLEPKSFIEAVE